MKAIFNFNIILIFVISISFFSCSKEEIIPADVEINNFVWGGMNAYYKWQGEIDDLADTNFSTREQLNDYLSDFDTADELFNSLLLTSVDDLSFITDDFTSIEDAFDGIKFTTGMKINGMPYLNGGGFYAYVYDVIEGSNADLQGVSRGMIITEINGSALNLSNVEGLFDQDNFSITLADYNQGNPISNGTVINLSKSNIQENPIKISKVFDLGTSRIGYILYNNFTTTYDDELNAVFASLRDFGVDDLIIDLRYNGGGSVESAGYLGSMITGQFEDEVFSKQIWNDKVMTNVLNQNVTNFFTSEINNGEVNQSISSLGLSTVYFIVSDATAGPAEVLINSLKEYIDVKLIGSQTKGLVEGSLTIYDSDDYTKNGENFNTSHTWALQPLVLEVQNTNNTNEVTGHIVDEELFEDSGNLGTLGEYLSDEVSGIAADPILVSTINYIENGSINPFQTTSPVTTQNLWNSSMLFLDFDKMYVSLRN